VSALIFADGSTWADGVYRLDVPTAGGPIALDVCIGDGPGAARTGTAGEGTAGGAGTGTAGGGTAGAAGTGTAQGPAGVTVAPSVGDPLFDPLVARLSGRSGAWGIGSAGWGIGPVSGSPWSAWTPADPREVSGRALPPPACATLDRLRGGIVVAVTAPRGLPPDWAVDVTRYDGEGVALPPMQVRQVSPAGNRGVAYLIRPDDGPWPPGAYRFGIRTASGTVALDTCLLAL
jgi:hypothetical protein